jgi:WD40 repeat protein
MDSCRQASRSHLALGVAALVLAATGGVGESGKFTEQPRVPSSIKRVLFWPDATHVIGTDGRRIIKLDLTTGKAAWTSPESVHSLFMAMDRRGKHLVALVDWEPKLIDAETGQVLRTVRPPQKITNHPGDVAISPDGGTLAIAAGADHRVLLNALPSGKPLRVIRTQHRAQSVAFSPNGRLLAVSADALPGFSLYDSRGRRKLKQITWDGRIGGTATQLVFSPDSRRVAGSLRRQLWVWDVKSGRALWRAKQVHMGHFGSAVFSPDGKWLAANGVWPVRPDNMYMAVRLWDADSGKEVATLTDLRHGNGGGNLPFAFSPDGTRLATVFERVEPRGITIWHWDGKEAGAPRPPRAEAKLPEAPGDAPARGKPRVWRNRRGEPLKAKFMAFKAGKVTLRTKDGIKVVPFEVFSKADRAYLRTLLEKEPNAPGKRRPGAPGR